MFAIKAFREGVLDSFTKAVEQLGSEVMGLWVRMHVQ